MAKIKITQIRSQIGSDWRQKATLIALGIKKLNRPVTHEVTPQIMGMVKKLHHLVIVEEV
jgi:large subunit ribosomal protein L30